MCKILIVDDSKVIRGLIRHELGSAYEYREARTGLEALKLIREGFVPDLITLDVEMPELDGFATCERLYREDFAGIFVGHNEGRVPIIFLTASDTVADRRRGFELGAIDFVSKKFEPGTLAALVKKTIKPDDQLRGIQVLLVDDSRTIRHIVGSALRGVGVTVIEAADGLEGFTILCNRLSSIDLLITDIEMPVMNGPELCRRVRRDLGLIHLPVIFFTGADQELRLEAFQAGATDCLSKPFIKEEMIARLKTHIEKAYLHARLRDSLAEHRANLQYQRDILATLSHDMRAPLSGIMGFADLLLMTQNRSAPELENITLIKQSGQMLLSLVEDILSLSKQQAGQLDLVLQPLQLGPLVASSVVIFQGLAARKRQEIVVTDKIGGMPIAGHAESLARVFNNLISNALKFTGEGGKVYVTLEPAPPDKIAVTVADTGVGISPDLIGSIFDRYSKASRKGTAGEASTGLGMSIVREFVVAHRGEIVVTSTPGKGTEFRLTFQRVENVTAAGDSQPANAKVESRHAQLCRLVRGRRVLVTDDNEINHLIAQAVLADAGCAVKLANSGAEALALLNATPGGFDLVFMDMRMPGMDGLATTQAIRAAGLDRLPVIALTGGKADEANRDQCRAAGMNDFLSKPFSPRTMLEMIVQYCGPGG
jgi:CheY-like chemotaxis protein